MAPVQRSRNRHGLGSEIFGDGPFLAVVVRHKETFYSPGRVTDEQMKLGGFRAMPLEDS